MYKCQFCSHKCTSIHGFIEHVKSHRHLPNFKYPCPFAHCLMSFQEIGQMRNHAYRYHHQARFNLRVQDQISSHGFPERIICCVPLCTKKFDSVSKLISHLCSHLKNDHQRSVSCPFKNCLKSYTKASSLKAHISRNHQLVYECLLDVCKEKSAEPGDATEHEDVHSAWTEPCVESDEPKTPGHEGTDDFNSQSMLENSALFYEKLTSKHMIPSTTVQIIYEEMQTLQSIWKEKFSSALSQFSASEGIDEEKTKAVLAKLNDTALLDWVSPPELTSVKNRTKFFKKTFPYIDPEEVVLGHTRNGKPITYHYVPIEKVLMAFHSKLGDDCVSNCPTTNESVLGDIHDGSVYQNHPLFSSQMKAFQVILYQDAFEVVNPLGSAKTKHKLLAVYFILGNLPKEIRSNVSNKQLVLLVKESDLKLISDDKEVVYSKLFERLISDLKKLEMDGYDVSGNAIKGAVLAITGDNLGSHSIGGFVESFSSQYSCRYCTISKDHFFHHPDSLEQKRNPDSHETHLQDGSLGVKFDSPFNALHFFHVCNPGLPPCIAHDVFEGVVAFDLQLFIKYFVVLKWFSFEALNQLIESFPYIGSDARDNPCTQKSTSVKLSGHAVQVWTFLQLFPLLVEHLVKDPSDKVWQLVLSLRSIVSLVVSHKISKHQIAKMGVLIEEYVLTRKDLFPDVPLRPKHHYMVHYPELTLEFGPLIRYWTLRFESKHSYFKKRCRSAGNFRNVTKMLSQQHQLFQAYRFTGELFPPMVECQSCVPFDSNVSSILDDCNLQLHGVAQHNSVISYSVKIMGTTYKKGSHLVIEGDIDQLYAGKIMMMVIKDGKQVMFVCEMFKLIEDHQMGFYYLESTNSYCCRSHQMLLDFTPINVYGRKTTLRHDFF